MSDFNHIHVLSGKDHYLIDNKLLLKDFGNNNINAISISNPLVAILAHNSKSVIFMMHLEHAQKNI